MRAIIIVLAVLALQGCTSTKGKYVKKGVGKSRFKAVSTKFKSIETAYAEVHGDCQKAWAKDFGSLGNTNASFAVEIIAVDKATSFLSALCVATTYEVSQAVGSYKSSY